MLTNPLMPPPEEKPAGALDRWFHRMEDWASRRAAWVIAISLLFAVLSLWYTGENLTFKTKRSDLIARDLPYDILYKKYREEFEDFDGMIIVVEGDNPESMKGFTEDMVGRLDKHRSSFHEIYYKVDTSYFKSRALLFMDFPDLKDLGVKLREHETFLENINHSPGLNPLLINLNREISAGMVDSLLSDFLTAEEDQEKDDTADLTLLISLFRELRAHLAGDAPFRSIWKSFLTDREDSLEEDGFLVSNGGNLMFVLLSPKETVDDFAGSKNAIELIRGVIREARAGYPDVKVGLTGGDVISSDEMFTTMKDVKLASQIALAGVAFLFIFAYRGVVKPLLAVGALLVALAWSMGYTTLAVGHLNILSVVFTTILIGLGIDFGIHILERYREERREGHALRGALLRTLKGTGRGNLTGAITTAIAFGSMAFTDFIGIVELGIIASGGILLCWVAMVLLLPALVGLEERLRNLTYPKPAFQPRKEKWLRGVFQRSSWIIVASLLLLLWAGWKTAHMKFDYNLLNLQAKGTEAVEWEIKIIENAKRATWYLAVVSDTVEEAERKLAQIQKLPSVGKIDSIFTAIPEQQDEKIKYIAQLKKDLPDFTVAAEDEPFNLEAFKASLEQVRFKLRKKEKNGGRDDVFEASKLVEALRQDLNTMEPRVAEARLAGFSTKMFEDYRTIIQDMKKALNPDPIRVDQMPDLLKKRFVGRTGKHLILVYPGINIWERPAMEQFLKEMRAIDPNVTGNAAHMFESSRLMINGYIQGGIYALLAIIVYLLVTLRSIPSTLLVLIPTLAGSIWTVGFMDIAQVQFNMANLVILPLIIGIGVVNGVHILHRFRESPHADNIVLSRSTGQAVVLSSLTTMIGFGSLMTADHRGVYSLGLVLSIGVGSCLLASVTLLPAMLKFGSQRGWKL